MKTTWIASGFSSLINSGAGRVTNIPDRRNIQLTNFMAILLVVCMLAIFGFRLSTGILNGWMVAPLIVGMLFFLCPMVFNRLGYLFLSRVLVCWIPPLFVIIISGYMITNAEQPETSLYLGLRIYLIAFSTFPFLVFNLSEKGKLFLGMSVPLIATLGYDYILHLMGLGYSTMGLSDSTYYYSNFRVLISVSLVSGSFIFLKSILAHQDERNTRLIRELKEKNSLLEKDTQRRLRQAYKRLNYHITNTPLAVIEFDDAFRIVFWNRRAEELFGWTKEEVIGKQPEELFISSRDYMNEWSSLKRGRGDTHEGVNIEVPTLSKSGTTLQCQWYFSK